MTIRYIQSKLRALRLVQESSFEADPGSGYILARLAHDIAWAPDQTKHMVEPQKSSAMRGPDGNVNGGKGGTISWKCPLNTKSLGALSTLFTPFAATDPPYDYESRAAATGTVTAGTATSITLPTSASHIVGRPIIHKPTRFCTFTAGSTDTCNRNSHGLVNGDIVRFCVDGGGALPTGINSSTNYYVVNKTDNDFQISLTLGGSAINLSDVGTASQYYIRNGYGSLRWVTRVTVGAPNDVLDVNRAFAQTPASGDSVEAVSSFSPSTGPVKTFTIHAFGGQGSTDKFKLVATGCNVTFKLASAGPKALPEIEFSAQVSSWSYSEASLTQATFSETSPASILGGLLYVAGSALATRSISFDPGMEIAEMESLDTNGRSGWNCSNSAPKVDMSLLHDTDILDKWCNNTNVTIEFNRFISFDNCWGFYIPAAQISKATHEDAGVLNIKPEIVAVDPGVNADSAFYLLWNFAICGV